MYNNIKYILIQYIIIRIIEILLILKKRKCERIYMKEILDKKCSGGVNSNLVNKQKKEYKRRLE